jgi:hypothetical protein
MISETTEQLIVWTIELIRSDSALHKAFHSDESKEPFVCLRRDVVGWELLSRREFVSRFCC